MKKFVSKCYLMIFGLLVMSAGSASACSVCMGDEGSNVGSASNGAIFLMLGVVFAMLSSFGGFIYYLAKRERMPLPPHEELSRPATGAI